jgi:DNA repair ATPase RecN
MAQKTKIQKTTGKKKTTAGRTRKKAEGQPEEMIRLLKEVDDHLSSLGELYTQYREAFEKVTRKLDQWEGRFDRFNTVASRLAELESEVRDLTRGYLERIEALEKRQAHIEALERREEQEAA